MKDTDRGDIHDELNSGTRTTRYEVEMFIATDDGLQPFEAFTSDSPPLLPDEGETLQVNWIEDEEGNEVHEAVPVSSVGSDKPYNKKYSKELTVESVNTNYERRSRIVDDEEVRRVQINKTVRLEP